MKTTQINRKSNGFTLIEMLVTISIIAILSSMVVIGYTNLIKKAAISNDKVLVNQVNNLLLAHRVEEDLYEDIEIANALRAVLGTHVEVQSQDYEMDIYYNRSNSTFELMNNTDALQFMTINEYLNFYLENDQTQEVPPPSNDNDKTEDETVKTFNFKDNLTVASRNIYFNVEECGKLTPATLNINELIEKLVPDLNLLYELTPKSIVHFENYEKIPPDENSDSITFYNPGSYELTINYGNYEESISVNILNGNYLNENDIAILDNHKENNTKPAHIVNSTDEHYDLQIPILFYFSIDDYYWDNGYSKTVLTANEFLRNFDDETIDLSNERLEVIVNGNKMELTHVKELGVCVIIEDLVELQNTFTVEYHYQGLNGKWVNYTQELEIERINDETKVLIK